MDSVPLDEIEASFEALSLFESHRANIGYQQQCPDQIMKRERDRVDHDDDPDVMPLSKRMNNIHFDGISGRAHVVPDNGSAVVMNGYSEINSIGNLNINGNLPSTSVSAFVNGVSNPMLPTHPHAESQPNALINQAQYSPVLSRQENPIYYDQNKVLFELYRERILRNNYPPHPDFANR